MSRLSTNMHPLLTNDIIGSLFNKNIHTTMNFIDADIKQLSIITGLAYKNVLTIKKHILNKNSAVIRHGSDYFHEMVKKCAIVPTGIENLDVLLEGGLNTGNIHEICGLPASGKTQCCLVLAKNTVRNLAQYVYYLDTKGDFDCKRVKEILETDGISQLEIGKILSKILVKQINTPHQLINSLHEIKNDMINGLKLRLIIIDSLPVLFYQISDVVKRNSLLNHIVNVARFMCVEYHMTFVVTNILTTWYVGSFGEQQNLTEKIGGGKYWLGMPNVRLKFTKDDEGRIMVSVLKTNKSTNGKECAVHINASGIT